MSKQTYLDWVGLMRVGLHELKLHPKAFWDLTPFELALMSGAIGQQSRTLTRKEFEALYAQFPDEI